MAQPFDVTDADFEQRVIRRSAELPVLVDFWADWCRPCHMLAPVIERAVAAHDSKVELAKLDTDRNPAPLRGARAADREGVPRRRGDGGVHRRPAATRGGPLRGGARALGGRRA